MEVKIKERKKLISNMHFNIFFIISLTLLEITILYEIHFLFNEFHL